MSFLFLGPRALGKVPSVKELSTNLDSFIYQQVSRNRECFLNFEVMTKAKFRNFLWLNLLTF